MKILDGQGSGKLAGVNEDHRLLTETISTTNMAHVSDDSQEAFGIGTLTNTVTTSETDVLVFKNTGTRSFYVNRMIIGHDGGSTNFNRSIVATLYKDSTLPTVNEIQTTPVNLNTGSTKTAAIDVYIWDQVSTGLDGTRGTAILSQIFGVGLTEADSAGSIIIAPGSIMRISCQALSETTKVKISVTGWIA